MLFNFGIAVAAVIAGGIASISGFGIGSILTPLLAILVGTKVAVAAVSIPHLIATALRFALLREQACVRQFWNYQCRWWACRRFPACEV